MTDVRIPVPTPPADCTYNDLVVIMEFNYEDPAGFTTSLHRADFLPGAFPFPPLDGNLVVVLRLGYQPRGEA